MRHQLAGVLLATFLVSLPGSAELASPDGAICLTNYSEGETIRYPVPLLRGTVADPAAKDVSVRNLTPGADTEPYAGLLDEGRFKVLCELRPGANQLVLQAGDHTLSFALRYEPQTNPYVVRVIYWTDSSGDTAYQTPLEHDPQNFAAKLDTAMKLMQTFTAESLHDQGLGRATFNLELDEHGKTGVHVMRGDRTAAEYWQLDGGELYRAAAEEVARKLPHPRANHLIIPAFTHFDPIEQKVRCHAALGGGNQALFGSGDLFSWPNSVRQIQAAFMDATRVDPRRVLSDSVGRHTFWANASTTIGACLHELGHTFGLPHSNHPHDIMTRGIDRLNRFFTFADPPHAERAEPYRFRDDEVGIWAPVSAHALIPNRFFALDAREWHDEPLTAFALQPERGEVRVDCPDGVRYLGVYRYDAGGVEAQFHMPLPSPPPLEVTVPLSLLGRRLGTPNALLKVIDAEGLSAEARVPDLLAGPFVQAWRFAPETRPWETYDAFPALSDADIAQIETAALVREPLRSPGGYVDFLRWCPTNRRENVAGYAVAVVRTDAPRRVRLWTGSDDALRVWVNRELVTSVLTLRSPAADAESSLATLRAGQNVILAEVSQAGGGWGLYLRLEDEDGVPLRVDDDGHLTPADPAVVARLRQLLRGPFVRRWQFAPDTRPWPDPSRFMSLSPDDVRAIQEAALAQPLAGSEESGAAVDFAPHFPPERRERVSGYAARVVRSDRERTVTLWTGSDDALRVWVNGELVTSVLALRGVRADAEASQAHLVAGDNVILAEVSQCLGDWGLALRMEDEDGADLFLADDGSLARAP